MIDAGFLELARLGELPESLPLIASSLTVVDATISVSTPSGTGFDYPGNTTTLLTTPPQLQGVTVP